jgi:uracil-DNA glycosylase family 4
MSRMPDGLASAIEARLRYYRDMGVYDLYRRGEPSAEASAFVAAAEIEASAVAEPAVADLSSVIEAVEDSRAAAPASKLEALRVLQQDIGECTRCPLAFQGRHKIVFGDGDPHARLMFVGEGPGADEDMQGLPFVGRAGQLLNNMISAMGLKREQVYIANIVKCRPPQNRVPEPEEANTCSPFLLRQIEIVAPEVIVALGSTAATYLLGAKSALSALRGRIHQAQNSKLIVTYHPAYLLRDPRQKKEAWADLQIAMRELGLKAQKPAEG